MVPSIVRGVEAALACHVVLLGMLSQARINKPGEYERGRGEVAERQEKVKARYSYD